MEPWQMIALLGLVLFIFSMIGRKRPAPAGNPTSMREIEETMEHFVQELEEDNKELLKHISELKRDHEQQIARLNGKIDLLEKQAHDLKQETAQAIQKVERTLSEWPKPRDDRSVPAVAERQAAASAEPQSVPSGAGEASAAQENAIRTIRERYQDVFDYYRQGKSVEFIAKKCGMNKGEIQLILKLASQEDGTGVEQ